jgi:pimeloyl-[acyl-carrier protein] synthase
MTIAEESVVDVFDEEFQRNPYGVLREARTRARCARDPFGSLILLRADDFEAVASDGRFGAFGDRLARMLGLEAGPAYDWLAGSLMFLDPPDHTRLRGFARKEFTPRRVAALQNAILATTDQLLDAVLPHTEMEFIGEFASRLPLITICQLLGVPTSDWALLRDWSAQLLPNNPNQVPTADRAVTEFRDYVEALIRQRRRSPSEDLVSALTAAASDGKLTPDELWILITLLVFAGNDTTMGLLANSVYLLVSHPDQLKLVKDQPETYIDTAIEEFLRFEPPVSGNGRIARQDVQLGDLTIAAGQELRLMPVAVNRDPLRFAEPDVFDIQRSPNRHMSFGWGPHLCLGATLARAEARIAIPRVLKRLDDIELATPRAIWAATRGRTLESLPLTFTSSAP